MRNIVVILYVKIILGQQDENNSSRMNGDDAVDVPYFLYLTPPSIKRCHPINAT